MLLTTTTTEKDGLRVGLVISGWRSGFRGRRGESLGPTQAAPLRPILVVVSGAPLRGTGFAPTVLCGRYSAERRTSIFSSVLD